MSIGLTSTWRSKQSKQKRCNRCELYYVQSLDKCSHCADLNGAELTRLKKTHHDNSTFGQYLGFVALIIGLLLPLNFL
ncbi:hypothetical protein ESZ28_09020 [Colwellia hornerae]|uniref:Uncharacterized protein n=1 Tax=Colwellia hornerae TaxID=89402 RepID=A0A5C6QLP7_9GAMM|nr:hypothetical protein ESZ28_09020 [Colwellia hornerae]TWX60380.1 hypothetical protein ESZ26_07795 [Colwellia hornerae]TWX70136.1 hypothetical protein ESZ27_04485 [Colwellia hornerae]